MDPITSSGQLQRFLDGSREYAKLPGKAHTPRFNLEVLAPANQAEGTEWFYIRDHNERIGLIQTWSKEIEMFRFSPAARGRRLKYEIPAVYHWANLFGARIQMYGTQKLPPVTSFRLTFTKDRGDSLELRVEHSHKGNLKGISEYRLTWDQRLGYVWDAHSRYSMPRPRAVEFNNLLAGGISESREDRKRWQKTIRMLSDGRIAFVHHSPIHLPSDDISAGGFVGFVAEEDTNPFVELLDTSAPVFMDTCAQWYDQHICMRPPRTRAADGLYHVRARYRFLSLPGAVARELELKAVQAAPSRQRRALGFLLNRPNDFETFILREGGFNGSVWRRARRSNEQAHSGRYSLKVIGRGVGKVVSVAPIAGGPALIGESKHRYRLTAWLMTDLSEGVAYVRVDDSRWSWDDVRATRRSREVSGRHGWTRLTVEFQPSPHDPFLVVRLCVNGRGAAWFDDVMLEERRASDLYFGAVRAPRQPF